MQAIKRAVPIRQSNAGIDKGGDVRDDRDVRCLLRGYCPFCPYCPASPDLDGRYLTPPHRLPPRIERG